MATFIIKRRFPNFFSGFEDQETEHEVSSRQDLEEIDWIKHCTTNPNHHTLAVSPKPYDWGSHLLLTLGDYDEEYGGCKSFWVIGYIKGDPLEDLGLPHSDPLIARHKDECPQKQGHHMACTCGLK